MTDFILNPIVDFCTNLIGDTGYLGIFLLMTVESANIPVPSEATMLFAGFKVDDGDLTLLGITAAGVLGNTIGSWAGYAIGYYGREELLERHHVFHVNPKQIARVEAWFERYGAVTVFFTRMIPIVRTFVSTPAGAARMPFWKFTTYTVAGCVPWVLMLGFIGTQVGANWEDWKDKLHYFDYLVVLALIGLGVYWLIKGRRGPGGGDGQGEDEERLPEPPHEVQPATEA
jgi:membrane protein DedA with SNARE-associated domain